MKINKIKRMDLNMDLEKKLVHQEIFMKENLRSN